MILFIEILTGIIASKIMEFQKNVIKPAFCEQFQFKSIYYLNFKISGINGFVVLDSFPPPPSKQKNLSKDSGTEK